MFDKLMALVAVIEKDSPQLKEVWNSAVDVFGPSLSGIKLAEPADAKVQEACEILKACCEAKLTVDGPVGGIFPGDGSVLKALLQFITTILPLVLTPTPPAA
jgi:hypothetical protein